MHAKYKRRSFDSLRFASVAQDDRSFLEQANQLWSKRMS